ncbi:uncharacterized protein LOC134536847 [Bacillus rossius redtenbacheri]|uniref:uncharacterized protein LOC134536847 n=1 Tax=Bacillus rossius redtenbacheri TaxID=93214 RepID=UPI002FDD9A1C
MAVYIQHKDTEQVLDVKESDTEPGAEVVLYTYYATPNQHWKFRDGLIVSELSGLALDVDAASGKLVTAAESGAPSQRWTPEDGGLLRNGDGRFLTAVYPEAEDGDVSLAASPERCDQPAAQEFALVPAEAS